MIDRCNFKRWHLLLFTVSVLPIIFTRCKGIEVSEFSFESDSSRQIVVFRCLNRLSGNEKLETFRLRLNGSEFYSYAPYASANYQKQAQFWIDGVSVDIEGSNGTHVILNNVRNRIKGTFTCKISSKMGRSVSEKQHTFVIGIDVPNGDEQIQSRMIPSIVRGSGSSSITTTVPTLTTLSPPSQSSTPRPITSHNPPLSPSPWEFERPQPPYSHRYAQHATRVAYDSNRPSSFQSEADNLVHPTSRIDSSHSKIVNPEYLSHFTRLNFAKVSSEINELRDELDKLSKTVRTLEYHVREKFRVSG